MIRLVLIPSVVALVVWLVASGYLIFQGFYNRQVANSVRQVSIPAVSALSSIQQERRLSVSYLTQPSRDLSRLIEQRQQTDQLLAALRPAADSALASAPDSIVTRWETLAGLLDEMASVRSTIDSRSANGTGVYDFYNRLLDAATGLFDTQARIVPDVIAAQGGIAATEAFRASDLMSRAGSTIDGAFGARTLSPEDHLDFTNLVGAYHAGLTNVAPHLEPQARRRYAEITASDSWKQLVAAEKALVSNGPWRSGAPRALSFNRAQWETLTRQVSDDLINLTVVQADTVSARTLRTGNTQLLTASLGSLIALLVVIAAIIWAVRQSQILVDRALSVRLAQLGRDAESVVDKQLPAMMERLRRREKVDLAAELPLQDYGSDEIGRVAEVINRSLQAAAGAAVDEAKTRAAGIAMLMGVARRPQRPLQRGLKVIEDLQNRIGDEKLLAELFDINHQLTQTRRFLENLVILAGGQIGRRFQNPVPVRRVLLAAFAEAQQYQRITLRSAPDVAVVGPAVAGTVHLVAELLDNALAFSPPETTVWVTCIEVKRGIAVEIEDAGVGMRADALERANELLATAPTPDVTALKDGAQVGLHVVAELAKRDGVQVSLRASAYGGLLAIVLLPDRVIATDPFPADLDRTDPGVLPLGTVATAMSRPGVGAVLPVGGGRRELHPAAGARPAAMVATAAGGSVQAPADPAGGRQPDRIGGIMTDVPAQRGAVRSGASGPQVADRPPLPHRRPQQHLAPELREEGLPAPASEAAPAAVRSPEEARDRFTRYQRAWAAGRAAKNGDPASRDDQGRKV
ncbi:nitrate- and nitrite sensing domain-containing protein [Micromonospora sp. RL09-050-HVF-A]|uniref:nitrate- and nitrite sensing domain-containing protein n=1 Tax=Micromonospora sp. RL09-050-HVF-A TaxID=1703433 RepID=UPI0027E29C35|nr:nitrate- and nitrite sensing domain-containing protein [Micromonospora sp. RL09-050-HVF-A]